MLFVKLPNIGLSESVSWFRGLSWLLGLSGLDGEKGLRKSRGFEEEIAVAASAAAEVVVEVVCVAAADDDARSKRIPSSPTCEVLNCSIKTVHFSRTRYQLTLSIYVSAKEIGFLPANTTSRFSTKLTTLSANTSSAETRYFRMGLVGSSGGLYTGSALMVERRWTSSSGSRDISSWKYELNRWSFGDCTSIGMINGGNVQKNCKRLAKTR
jgi:hypothetical protein